MEWYLILLWNLRQVLSRWTSDILPDDSGDVAADSFATAYDAFETHGFRMFGAFGNPGKDAESLDSLTKATGFHPLSGEAIGLQVSDTDFNAEYDSGENLNHGADENEGNASSAAYWSSAQGLADTADMSDDHPSATVADSRYARTESKELRRQASEVSESLRGAYAEFYGYRREGNFDAASDAWRTILEIKDSAASLRIEADEIDESAKCHGRWAHYRDGHIAEQSAIDSHLNRPVGNPGPLPGEMEAAKVAREEYAARIARKLERMRAMYRNATLRGKTDRKALIASAANQYKRDIRAQYSSMARNLGPGKDKLRWRFLPLTKAQLESLGV